MKFYTIEVDEKVWNYLKENAEPFKDTPNSVLNEIIFGTGGKTIPKTTLSSEPDKRHLPEIEIQPENDLTIDGIKLELESAEGPDKNRPEYSFDTTNQSNPESIENLRFEPDNKFNTNKNDDEYSIKLSETTKNNKDIDDFINELEKSTATGNIQEEFSNILKEIPKTEDEWQEISIQPKQQLEVDNQSPIIKTSLKEPALEKHSQRKPIVKKPPEKKKPKLISLEDKLIYSLGLRLQNQWGDFRQEGVGLLFFTNKTVLCKLSKYNSQNGRWFWEISQADRYSWGPQNWLALILENEDQNNYSFLLFNSQESGVLFDQCTQTTGDKYITMLIDDSYESARIQEWRHLDLRDRIKALPLYKPENE
jgi:hypothetical protein